MDYSAADISTVLLGYIASQTHWEDTNAQPPRPLNDSATQVEKAKFTEEYTKLRNCSQLIEFGWDCQGHGLNALQSSLEEDAMLEVCAKACSFQAPRGCQHQDTLPYQPNATLKSRKQINVPNTWNNPIDLPTKFGWKTKPASPSCDTYLVSFQQFL
jgi:hypothetical protein